MVGKRKSIPKPAHQEELERLRDEIDRLNEYVGAEEREYAARINLLIKQSSFLAKELADIYQLIGTDEAVHWTVNQWMEHAEDMVQLKGA